MKIWSLSADGKFIQLLEIDSNCHYNPKAQARINYGFVYLNTCSDPANAAAADQLPQLSLVAAAKSVGGGGGASSSLSPPPSDRTASSSLFSSAPAHQHIYSTSLATVLIFGHLIVWHT